MCICMCGTFLCAEQEGPVLFTTILGGAMAFGSSKTVENVNNSLVAVVLIRYAPSL
jgi:hypothetical protein